MFGKTHILTTQSFTLLVALKCNQLGINLYWVDNGEDLPTVATYRCSNRKFKKLHNFMMENELGLTF